ncbi:GlyGly-CTERM sorting domain-containing protein (plasmid) [Ralstonia syzygii]|uniref:GlyGly-CTERM sorting domain-containing protein n=1 Tax=Ralstonia syzygii TaxID=28097 RepID=A0ABX7ZKT3_9RALS|nr:GlyGly-CTERM sorting domain-containing protein [Ralstonia syzygii]
MFRSGEGSLPLISLLALFPFWARRKDIQSCA